MNNRRWMGVVAVGLAAAVLVAFLSPWASSHPDGLEKVAAEKEFLDTAKDPSYEIIPDYAVPGVENEKVATILSGLIGIAIVVGIGFGLMFLLKAMRPKTDGGSSSSSAARTG